MMTYRATARLDEATIMPSNVPPPLSDSSTSQSRHKPWTGSRTEFLNIPDEFSAFLETLDRWIFVAVSDAEKNWNLVISTNEFKEAFNFVLDRLLSDDGFPNVVEIYNDSARTMSLWDFVTNRASLILAEWTNDRRDKPSPQLFSDEHIETRSDARALVLPAEAETVMPYATLSKRIDLLSKPEQAVLILRLWPLDVLPDRWRVKYSPVICDVAEENGNAKAETLEKLAAVTKMEIPGSPKKQQELDQEEALIELYAKEFAHFASERYFDRQKRLVASRIRQSESDGDGADTLLAFECYASVKMSSEKAVLQRFSNDDLYTKSTLGRSRIKNRLLWYRRRFSQCCYKQRRHRRVWLNTFAEIAGKKPVNGPMAHSVIANILNCPVGTCESNLSRARGKLLESGLDKKEVNYGAMFSANAEEHSPEFFEQELQEERLQKYVCENLRPSAQ